MSTEPYRVDDVDRVDPVTPEELAEEIALYEQHQAHQQALTVPQLQRALKASLGDQVTNITPQSLRMRRNH